jgi:hypothetical protein
MDSIAVDVETGLALPVASKGDKAFLRAAVTLRVEHVAMPEWGRTVVVREMTAEENREYQISNLKWDARGNPVGFKRQDLDLRLILRTCVDDHAVRLFGEDDLPLLRKQPAAVIMRLLRVAKRLSGLNDDEDAATHAEQEKND